MDEISTNEYSIIRRLSSRSAPRHAAGGQDSFSGIGNAAPVNTPNGNLWAWLDADCPRMQPVRLWRDLLRPLLDHLGERQQCRRHGEAERARRPEVDDELVLARLLDRQLARLGAFENLVHERSRATIERLEALAVAHQAP